MGSPTSRVPYTRDYKATQICYESRHMWILFYGIKAYTRQIKKGVDIVKYNCDICSQPVAKHEDISMVDSIYHGDVNSVLFHKPRHVICDPSRARYIDNEQFRHFPLPAVTTSQLIALVEKRCKEWTESWIKLQVICGLTTSASITVH